MVTARDAHLDLRRVEEEFHDTVRNVYRDVKAYAGGITWLVPFENGAPFLKDRFVIPDNLPDVGAKVINRLFDRERGNKRIWAIFPWRVSDQSMATDDGSLEASLRVALHKCAENDIWVAGLAPDIHTGKEANRPAMSAVDDAVSKGWINWLIPPSLDRMDRNERNFHDRQCRYADSKAITLYGRDYMDLDFDYVYWDHIRSRDRALPIVRAAEEFLQLQAKGKLSSLTDALLKGRFTTTNKRDTFVLIEVYTEKGQSYLRLARGSPATWLNVSTTLLDAAHERNLPRARTLVQTLSKEHGKDIALEDLFWEIEAGFPIGNNRQSPRSPHAGLPCDALTPALEPSFARYNEVLEAIAILRQLIPRRQRQLPLAVDLLSEEFKEGLAEIEEKEGLEHRLVHCCVRHDPPVPLKAAGIQEKDIGGLPQQAVFCPTCTPKPSGKGRNRLPQVKTLRVARKLPPMPCIECGGLADLTPWHEDRIGALTIPLHKCTACRLAPAAYSPPPASAPAVTPTRLAAPLAADAAAPSTKRTQLERGLSWLSKNRPADMPVERWLDAIPSGDIVYDGHELHPSRIAQRMLAFIVRVPRDCYVTFEQMKKAGIGASRLAVFPSLTALGLLRRLAAAEAVQLRELCDSGHRYRFFWVGKDAGKASTSSANPTFPQDHEDQSGRNAPRLESASPHRSAIQRTGSTRHQAYSWGSRKLWPQEITARPLGLAQQLPTAAGVRLLDLLREATPEHMLNREQVALCVVGDATDSAESRPVIRAALREVRRLLRNSDLTLASAFTSGRHRNLYWLQASDARSPPPLAPAPPAATAAEVESSVQWPRRTLGDDETPVGIPSPVFAGSLPVFSQFHTDLSRPAMAGRVLEFWLAQPNCSLRTDQLRTLSIGMELPPGPHPLRGYWNKAQLGLRAILPRHGLHLRCVKFENSKIRCYWLERLSP